MNELAEYEVAYQQMLDDCDGESPGWYAWIDFSLVKRMAAKLEAMEEARDIAVKGMRTAAKQLRELI